MSGGKPDRLQVKVVARPIPHKALPTRQYSRFPVCLIWISWILEASISFSTRAGFTTGLQWIDFRL